MKDEIVLYQFDKLSTHLKTIGKHIAKVLTEELHGFSVVAKFATTETNGKTYQSESHYRFLIIDGNDIYLLGATLKNLGKNWFAFSKLDKSSVDSILNLIFKLL